MKYALLFIIFLFCHQAKADISWMKGADNCNSFAPALDAYLDKVDLSKYSLFPFWQKEELAIVLREACSGKFSECNLEACKKWGTLASFTIPKEGSSSSLFWLNRFLTCEQLMEQIKSRYSNLPQQELSDETKQKEFRLVLSAACSDRFSHCSFASCQEYNQGKVGKDQLTGLAAEENKSEKVAQNYEALRASMIKLAEEQEKEQGLVWKKFSNPAEAEVVARRREEAGRRKAEEGEDEGNDSYESSSSYQYRKSYSSSRYSSSRYSSKRYSSRTKRRSSSSSRATGVLPF